MSLLLPRLRAGDHLIVRKLSAIDANPHRLDDALRLLAERRIHLYAVVERGGGWIHLSPNDVRVFALVWRLFRQMRRYYISATTRMALRTKRAMGQVHHRYPPYGKRRIRRKVKGRVEQHDVWDEIECEQIREIHRRKTAGETFDSIARDFYDRGLKKADGRAWVTKPKRKRKLNTSSLQRAFKYYADVLSRGLELGDDDA